MQVPLGVSSQLGNGEECDTASPEGLDWTTLFRTISGEHVCVRVHEMGQAWESRSVVRGGPGPRPGPHHRCPMPEQPELVSARCAHRRPCFPCFSRCSRKRRACPCVGAGLELPEMQGGVLALPGWGGGSRFSPGLSLAGGGRPSCAGCGDATQPCAMHLCPHALSLPSVASTPTAAVSAGRPPSRASASESWGPGTALLPPPQRTSSPAGLYQATNWTRHVQTGGCRKGLDWAL